MPRDIPVGNGQMLVTFDHHYQVRDLYFPHVGLENHAGGGPCRFGVWTTIPRDPTNVAERRRHRLFWSDNGWQVSLAYHPRTLATNVRLHHPLLKLELRCTDVVDFHRPVLVRRIEVANLLPEQRDVHLFHHNDFLMYGSKVGDTAYFDPRLRCLIHYRQSRYLMTCWYSEGDQRMDEYATGTAGFNGAEGTWRDAEDGRLGNNSIAQGAVDSTMMLAMQLGAAGTPEARRVVHMVIGAGHSYRDLRELHRFLHRDGPEAVIDRTRAYWRLWLDAGRTIDSDSDGSPPLPAEIVELYERSLLVLRTQIDNGGAIIAANDSDIMQFSRDTYSYLWPRDGALVAAALDDAGFPDVAKTFFTFCSRIITEHGCFLHKYNADGSLASSWHPWVSLGNPQLPIQEDETALVVWALWRHYARYRDIEYVRQLWLHLITPAADFLVRFRDPVTKLPLPSYNLWEDCWGVHAYTVATVYGGLVAAGHFAQCFGDQRRSKLYERAAEEVRQAFVEHFWSASHQRFYRRIVPLDHARTARLMAEVLANRAPRRMNDDATATQFEFDATIDSSLYGVFAFGLLPVRDEKVEKTMHAMLERLWVKTQVGGLARYEADHYQRRSEDLHAVPGNPWFICTLWIAQWHIDRATTLQELSAALPILQWTARHALPSGVLAEQVHPTTNAPLSVSPLTWSHGTVVATVRAYLDKRASLATR